MSICFCFWGYSSTLIFVFWNFICMESPLYVYVYIYRTALTACLSDKWFVTKIVSKEFVCQSWKGCWSLVFNLFSTFHSSKVIVTPSHLSWHIGITIYHQKIVKQQPFISHITEHNHISSKYILVNDGHIFIFLEIKFFMLPHSNLS